MIQRLGGVSEPRDAVRECGGTCGLFVSGVAAFASSILDDVGNRTA
jgi:hypothetical protein